MPISEQVGTQSVASNLSQCLTFVIGADTFALPLLKVREIIEYDVVTHVPRMPEWIRGVINLRGNIVPVIDLSVKFRQQPTTVGKQTCIVIADVQCENDPMVMGVIVDSVREVLEWGQDDIQAPPSFGTRLKADYLVGMAGSGSKFSLILDIDKILSLDELLELASTDDAVRETSSGDPESGTGDIAETEELKPNEQSS
jgi:purine-binding chemotaxis protein CheW